jgi:hypothetical protein
MHTVSMTIIEHKLVIEHLNIYFIFCMLRVTKTNMGAQRRALHNIFEFWKQKNNEKKPRKQMCWNYKVFKHTHHQTLIPFTFVPHIFLISNPLNNLNDYECTKHSST